MGERSAGLARPSRPSLRPAFAAAALLVLGIGSVASAATEKPVPNAQRPAATASGRAATKPAGKPTPKPSPSPSPTPAAKTPLSEEHEYALETQHETDTFNETIAAGIGRLLVALLWPIVTVVGLVLAARALQAWFAQRAVDTAPPLAAGSAVTANAQTSIAAADLQRVNAVLAQVLADYRAMVTPPPGVSAIFAEPLPGASPPALVAAHAEVGRYAERIARVMLGSQYGLLALAAARSLSYAEAAAAFADAQQNGYTATFGGWLGFLVRVGLVRSVAAGSAPSTVIAVTDLGLAFLGWFDAQGYTRQTFADQGRDI
jgi:hypothetical protein